MRSLTFWLIGISVFAGCPILAWDFRTAQAEQNVQNPFDPSPERVRNGLVALYDFNSSEGTTVKDRSGVGRPLDLRITNTKGVRRTRGALEVTAKTLIRSDQPAAKISESIRRSKEITIEAWIRPAQTSLSGPARIVTISRSSTDRNFTLGQDGHRFKARLRTTETSANGLPSLSSAGKSLTTGITHVVYTRDRSGKARFYINGNSSTDRTIAGNLSNWKQAFPFALANELSNDRPWLGTYYLVAVYHRALLPREVDQNFKAGAGAQLAPERLAQDGADPAANRLRTRRGLQVLYDFGSGEGPFVRDRSGVGKAIDLRIADLKSVRRSDGSLEIRRPTLIRSAKPPSRMIESVRRSGEISLETWLRPAKIDQQGPARIVSLSINSNSRNFTLGQEGDRFDVRLRTSETSENGLPSLSSVSKSLKTKLTHLVYTRDRTGRATIYVDGKRSRDSKVKGTTARWNGKYELALANELNNSRPWLGTYYLVAIYSRSLSSEEVTQNFNAGADAQSSPALLTHDQPSPAAIIFRTQIAALLSRHCLECHDSSSKQGGLDLSKKETALAGGDSGQAIIPGKSSESLLWESVASDEMPSERPPLSAEHKTLLREWIDGGAVWSMDVIDPAIYAHDRRAGDIWLQRLTVPEYIETVRSAVGVDISEDARKILPPELRADGFSNTAYNLNVDLAHVDAYATLAEIIVSRMDVLPFAAQFSKSSQG